MVVGVTGYQYNCGNDITSALDGFVVNEYFLSNGVYGTAITL